MPVQRSAVPDSPIQHLLTRLKNLGTEQNMDPTSRLRIHRHQQQRLMGPPHVQDPAFADAQTNTHAARG
jgi:hypothetical protein